MNSKVGWFESPSGRDIFSKSSTLSQENPFVSQKWMLVPTHSWYFKYQVYLKAKQPIIQLNLPITTTFTIQSIACSSCGNEDWWYVCVRATTLCLLGLIQVATWMSSNRRSSILSGGRHRQVLLCTFITLVAFDGRRGFLWRIMLGWRCLCLRSTCDGL